jgi:hypothetical protein
MATPRTYQGGRVAKQIPRYVLAGATLFRIDVASLPHFVRAPRSRPTDHNHALD